MKREVAEAFVNQCNGISNISLKINELRERLKGQLPVTKGTKSMVKYFSKLLAEKKKLRQELQRGLAHITGELKLEVGTTFRMWPNIAKEKREEEQEQRYKERKEKRNPKPLAIESTHFDACPYKYCSQSPICKDHCIYDQNSKQL